MWSRYLNVKDRQTDKRQYDMPFRNGAKQQSLTQKSWKDELNLKT